MAAPLARGKHEALDRAARRLGRFQPIVGMVERLDQTLDIAAVNVRDIG